MRPRLGLLLLLVLLVSVSGRAQNQARQQEKATDQPPSWAYGFASAPGTPASAPPAAAAPAAPAAQDDGTLRHLPTSTLAFTLTQIRDGFGPADWYPGDHPQMPEIVAHGRKPDVRACSLCHYPNGKGRPENAGVLGLPSAYFVQTIADFKSGARRSSDSRKGNTNNMIAYAKAMTDDEVQAAAEYFGAMKWTPWIKVVETDTVPKTRIAGGMFLALEGSEKEPIGQRIIEVPVNTEGTDVLRDARSGFIAYVPPGSLKKGEDLVVRGGNGKTVACAACHGQGLKGNDKFPFLAGRSPSYLARQLYDFQHFTRVGPGSTLMQPIVQKLSAEDIRDITAYIASLQPY
jgi:cytochrome c553